MATIYYSITVLALVNVHAQRPVAQGIGASTYGYIGFRDRVSQVLRLLLFLSAL